MPPKVSASATSDINPPKRTAPKRPRRHTEMRTAAEASVKKRLTVEIPAALDRNLEIYCVAVGHLKNEVTASALSEYLKSRKGDVLEFLASVAGE